VVDVRGRSGLRELCIRGVSGGEGLITDSQQVVLLPTQHGRSADLTRLPLA
jgi:hypothetical protein